MHQKHFISNFGYNSVAICHALSEPLKHQTVVKYKHYHSESRQTSIQTSYINKLQY